MIRHSLNADPLAAGGRGLSWRPWLLAAVLCLPQAAAAQDSGVEVDVTGAERVPCKDREVGEGRSLAEAEVCFRARATADLELRLESERPELLRSVVVSRQSSGGTSAMTRVQKPTHDSTTWTGALPLPRAALGSQPTPDAPLASQRGSFFRSSGPPDGPLAPGRHLIDLQLGAGDDLHAVVLGITITSAGRQGKLVQWPVADGRARLVLGGCWRRSLDSVVELVLTDCDDPGYQVKAVAVDPQGRLSLAQYVANSTRAYRQIWFDVTEQTDAGPPAVITLELEQLLAGKGHAIHKHFVDLEDRFLIVTFYGPSGKQKRLRRRVGPRSQWLLVGGGKAD